jgi:hypothetical protein
MFGFVNLLHTQLVLTNKYRAIADLHNLQLTVTHALEFPVFTSLTLVTELKILL